MTLEVAAKINKQLAKALGKRQAIAVPVEPLPGCTPDNCWVNVPLVIKAHGGSLISGRTIWRQTSNHWYHLEAHAVWEKLDGSLSDPTPKSFSERKIAFVRERLEYNGFAIPCKYIPLTDDKRILRFIALTTKCNEIRSTIPTGANRNLTPAEQDIFNEQSMLGMELFPGAAEQQLRNQLGFLDDLL